MQKRKRGLPASRPRLDEAGKEEAERKDLDLRSKASALKPTAVSCNFCRRLSLRTEAKQCPESPGILCGHGRMLHHVSH